MNRTEFILSLMGGLLLFVVGCFFGKAGVMRERIAGFTEKKTRSVTRLLMVDTVRCALVWVFLSYAVAIYSTVRLGIVYTLRELSEPAIYAILGVNLTKVTENIFEHNDGKFFGTSHERGVSDMGGEKRGLEPDRKNDL